ncbi:tetratricopeptide repeat protein [Anaerobacillus sp. MEB173]|uniref:tetratricopeptide repeat protein n=1 Tax=Anaerobacillus sp. MEB173 TaxID=3383345 RepID=UPI003F8E82B7
MNSNIHTANNGKQVISFTKNGEYFFEKGIHAYQKKDLKRAEKYLRRAIKLEPDEPVFICQLAAILADLGEYNKSNDLLLYVLDEIDGDMNECHFFLANNYANLGLFSEAHKAVKKYIENEFDGEFYEDAQDLLDLLLDENEEFEFPEVEEDRLIVLHEQAKTCLEKGQISKAIKVLEDMVAEYPNYWTAHNLLAEALVLAGKTELAIEMLERVIEKDPTNLNAYCNLVVFYRELGHHEKVKAVIEALKVVHPFNIDHYYKVATTLGLVEEHEQAYERFQFLAKKGFEGSAVYYHRFAVAAFQTGRMQKAEALWEKSEMRDGEVAQFYLKKLKKGLLKPEDVQYNYIIPTGV